MKRMELEMSEPEAGIGTWLAKNWPWLAWMLGLGSVALRNEWNTRRVTKQVFNDAGDPRLVRVVDCSACRRVCQDTWVKAIDDLKNGDIKEMKHDIKELLRGMKRE